MSAGTPNGIEAGHYWKKQVNCRSRSIAWAHRRRLEVALRLARRFTGRRVLDFGCGDGSFLALLMAGDRRPASAVGVELTTELMEDCSTRLRSLPDTRFITVAELDQAAAYDGVICMEVLEHVVDVEPVLATLGRLLAPGGQLIVSVPVETGLPLLVKQSARTLAGWRGIGDYPGTTGYTLRELAAAVLPLPGSPVTRPILRGNDGSAAYDHKGFDWKVLGRRLASRFDVQTVVGSPLEWLPPGLALHVWFVASRREEGRQGGDE